MPLEQLHPVNRTAKHQSYAEKHAEEAKGGRGNAKRNEEHPCSHKKLKEEKLEKGKAGEIYQKGIDGT